MPPLCAYFSMDSHLVYSEDSEYAKNIYFLKFQYPNLPTVKEKLLRFSFISWHPHKFNFLPFDRDFLNFIFHSGIRGDVVVVGGGGGFLSIYPPKVRRHSTATQGKPSTTTVTQTIKAGLFLKYTLPLQRHAH